MFSGSLVARYVAAGSDRKVGPAMGQSFIALLVCLTASLPLAGSFALPSNSPTTWMHVGLLWLMFTSTVINGMHLHFRAKPVTVALSDIPLMMALLIFDPWTTLAARWAACLTLLVLRRRSFDRTVFNVGLFAFETFTAFWVMRLFRPEPGVNWISVLAAFAGLVVVGHVVYAICILYVAWHDGTKPEIFDKQIHTVSFVLECAGLVFGTLFALLVGRSIVAAPGLIALLAMLGWISLVKQKASLRLEVLTEFRSRTQNMSMTEDQVLQASVEQVSKLVHADRGSIWATSSPRHVRPVLSRARPWYLGGAREGENFAEHERAVLEFSLRRDDSCFVDVRLSKRWADLGSFNGEDLRAIGPLVGHIETRWRAANLLNTLREAAMVDKATGLGTQLWMEEQLAGRHENGVMVHLICRDASALTTAFGAEVTTEVLLQLGARLREFSSSRGASVNARVGDASFAVWLPREYLTALPDLTQRLGEPIYHGTLSIAATFAVGYTELFAGADVVEGLRQAYAAASQALTSGSQVPLEYDSEMVAATRRRSQLTEDLRIALDDEALWVAYQPKVCADRGIPVGCEALVRWTHPIHGAIAPPDFIPLAEQSGQMARITKFVLQRSIADCGRWQSLRPEVGVAVNVSPADLEGDDFVEVVRSACRTAGLAPELLTIEITETTLMQQQELFAAHVAELRQFGVKVSIDDFGTGYSSLSYLQQVIVDEAKLDRSFVMGVTDDARRQGMVTHIIALLSGLGITTVAEGVEDEQTGGYLGSVGCQVLQGFGIARPMPIDQLLAWLDQPVHSHRL